MSSHPSPGMVRHCAVIGLLRAFMHAKCAGSWQQPVEMQLFPLYEHGGDGGGECQPTTPVDCSSTASGRSLLSSGPHPTSEPQRAHSS